MMPWLIFIILILSQSSAWAQQGQVLQTGQVTPGHVTVWATNGVVQDGGSAPAIVPGVAQLIGSNGSAFVPVSVGSGLALNAGVLSTSGAGSGTVTSVGLSLPSIFSVSGSPITTAGTLTGTFQTQTANLVFAGPTNGAPAQPTFRALGLTDLPSLSANTVLGALTATTPSGLAVPSCSTSLSALGWTSGSGYLCNTLSSTLNPVVADTTALRALATTAAPVGVIRETDGVAGAPALLYLPSGSACPGVGDNGGNQVASADGKCWIANFPSGTRPDVREWGMDPSGANDPTAAFSAAITAECTGSLYIPPGTYNFASTISSTCSPDIEADASANLHWPTTIVASDAMLFSGSQGTSTNLTADANAGATTLSVTSAAGFCQPATTGQPDPNCAVMVASNATWDDTNFHHVGELALIKSISGTTVTLFDRLAGSYLTADTAIAVPTVLIDHFRWSGGKITIDGATNTKRGLHLDFARDAKVQRVVFQNWGGLGSVQFQNVLGFEANGNYITGLGATETQVAYGIVSQDASIYGQIHDNWCYNTGSCVTFNESSGTAPGTYDQTIVSNNMAWTNTNATVENPFQTHWAGRNISFLDNTCYFVPNTSNSSCVTPAIPNVIVRGTKSFNSGNGGVNINNLTNQTGYIIADGNLVRTTGNSTPCITINTGGSVTLNGGANVVSASNNDVSGCAGRGILITNSGTTTATNVHVDHNRMSNFTIAGVGISVGVTRGSVNGNDITISTAGGFGIDVTNANRLTIASNNVEAPASFTGRGINLACSTTGSGQNNVVDGLTMFSPSDVSGTGILMATNCTNNIVAGALQLSGLTTPVAMNGGAGNVGISTNAALTAHGVVVGGGAGKPPTSTAVGTSGQVLTSNGAGVDPTFQTVSGTGTVTSVGLSVPATSIFGVTGSPVTTTGTLGLTTTVTSGGILYGSSGTQVASSGALTANAIVLGGGAGSAPTPLGSLGTTTTVLHGNAAGAPTFGAVANADLTNSSITIAGHSVSLGGTQAIACADLSTGATGCSTATGTSGATIPLLNGTNTFSGVQTFGEVISTVSVQSGTTYTFAATDCGTIVEFTSASAVTATLPNSLAIGCAIASVQGGAGQVTFTAAAGGTLVSAHSFTKTFAQHAIVSLSVIENSGGTAAQWTLSGDGA